MVLLRMFWIFRNERLELIYCIHWKHVAQFLRIYAWLHCFISLTRFDQVFTNCAWEPCWSCPQCICEYIWSICACRRWYLKERCRGARMRWRIHIREGFYSNSGWGRSSREGTHTLIPHMMLYHRCCAEERFLCMQSSLNTLYDT